MIDCNVVKWLKIADTRGSIGKATEIARICVELCVPSDEMCEEVTEILIPETISLQAPHLCLC